MACHLTAIASATRGRRRAVQRFVKRSTTSPSLSFNSRAVPVVVNVATSSSRWK